MRILFCLTPLLAGLGFSAYILFYSKAYIDDVLVLPSVLGGVVVTLLLFVAGYAGR